MPVELRIAAFGSLLLFVHIFTAIRFKTQQYGRKWNVGARDEALPPANPMTGRTIRAQANFAETFPIAIVALLGVVIAGRTSAMADVPQLKEAFRGGVDIHNMTAEELFGRVDRDTRNQAKTINFAILYGSSAWGIAGRLGVPKDEGKAIIDRYFARFPGIRSFIHSTLALARERGFTQTLFGRKTHFEPNIRSPNPSIRAGAERAAINAPIQGTSADLIKRAMPSAVMVVSTPGAR